MQKNNYMKILGVAFVVVVLTAIISVVYYGQVANLPISFFIPSHNTTPVMAEYDNGPYNFSVSYRKQYQLDTSGAAPNYYKAGGVTLSDISIPQSMYPKTNLGASHITFSVKDKSTLADCQTYVTGGGTTKKMTKIVTLDAGKFYTDGFKGAAAGTTYGTQLYRLLQDGTCYEAALTVGIANIQNFDPTSGVHEVVEADVWNDLTAVLVTFRFGDTTAANSAADGTDATGTLQGHVDIGPNCPVEQAGAPCPPSPDAYDGVQIIVYTADRNRIVTKGNLDSSGNYSIDLAAGSYYVTYASVYNFYQPPMKKVTVSAGQSTAQDFSIDTGIR